MTKEAFFRDLIQFEPCQQLGDVGGIDRRCAGLGAHRELEIRTNG